LPLVVFLHKHSTVEAVLTHGIPSRSDQAPVRRHSAESVIGLFKSEVIHHRGPWRNLDRVEYATLEWVDWFNNRRLLEPIGAIPPAEFELMYYRQQDVLAVAA
jgi:transposase InsO family protein